MLMTNRTCYVCRQTSGLDNFYATAYMCKPCHRVRDAERKGRAKVRNDTPAARERKRKWQAENRVAQANKQNARRITRTYIARGVLVRPDRCESCHLPAFRSDGVSAIQAHHDDYSKPVDVRWLCPKCHRAWHKLNDAAMHATGG